MRFPDFNYEFINKIAMVTIDGYIIGYINAKPHPCKKGVLYYGHPGNSHRQGKVIIKESMGCVARDLSMMYKRDGELTHGVYGEEARKVLEEAFGKKNK